LADAQHLPHGRHQAGDRHLKFHETRDNLMFPETDHYVRFRAGRSRSRDRPGRERAGARRAV